MMSTADADWPSLPPIRTSSSNARVSCETLNLHLSPPFTHACTSSSTPPSTSHPVNPASKSADASPQGPAPSSSSTSSHLFASCFPHIFHRGHGHDTGKRGLLDSSGLLRSMFGPVAPRYATYRSAFASGVSPPPNHTAPSPMSNSPSGRMSSPINVMRSGGSTPHHSGLLRTSKGHAGHAFTMIPPDVVGKKKPPNYESDEPTSPEVTCIGKVRRKHCKATWDALVKDKQKDGKKKKKGKVKQLSSEISREMMRKPADFEMKAKDAEPTVAAKLSRQRSERRRSLDIEGVSTDMDRPVWKYLDCAKDNRKAAMESGSEDAPRSSFEGMGHDSCSKSSSEDVDEHNQRRLSQEAECEHNEEPSIASQESALVLETPPPSNCLLLMKQGSRNRSVHYGSDAEFIGAHGQTRDQWNWGQVLT